MGEERSRGYESRLDQICTAVWLLCCARPIASKLCMFVCLFVLFSFKVPHPLGYVDRHTKKPLSRYKGNPPPSLGLYPFGG